MRRSRPRRAAPSSAASRGPSNAYLPTRAPDRERHPTRGLDVDEERPAIRAERGSGELVIEPRLPGPADQAVEGDVEQVTAAREAAEEVVVDVVLAQDQCPSAAGSHVVGKVERLGPGRLEHQLEGLAVG